MFLQNKFLCSLCSSKEIFVFLCVLPENFLCSSVSLQKKFCVPLCSSGPNGESGKEEDIIGKVSFSLIFRRCSLFFPSIFSRRFSRVQRPQVRPAKFLGQFPCCTCMWKRGVPDHPLPPPLPKGVSDPPSALLHPWIASRLNFILGPLPDREKS